MRLVLLTLGFLLVMVSALSAAEPENVASGKIQNNDALKQVPKSGIVTDQATFEKLWKAFRGEEALPDIDFEKKLVLVGTVDGPNLVMLNPKLEADGNLKYVVGGTRMAGPGFGYRMVAVDRDGVKTINGQPMNTSAVHGKIVIGKDLPGFERQALEIKLFEYDPLLADVSADLIDEVVIDDFSHAAGKEKSVPFGLGKDFQPRKDREYYITVFVVAGANRTHVGELSRESRINKVRPGKGSGEVVVTLRQVR
ncbi:hypothetical protein AB1L30_24000 [Bremerella sp. JC817]|uniref:hypothetical protein n=1 Tax=Bremerella sp. JC817 TaxID=3231756 RepID=UPI00345AC4A7